MGKRNKISTSGDSSSLGNNPFGNLSPDGLPEKKPEALKKAPTKAVEPKKKRGRVDIRREKSGRGGKIVTVVEGEGFLHTNPQELAQLLKVLKNRFGCGGVLKGKILEIQGDKRDAIAEELEGRGYRPVFTGG